jgi:hypothetical protein
MKHTYDGDVRVPGPVASNEINMESQDIASLDGLDVAGRRVRKLVASAEVRVACSLVPATVGFCDSILNRTRLVYARMSGAAGVVALRGTHQRRGRLSDLSRRRQVAHYPAVNDISN